MLAEIMISHASDKQFCNIIVIKLRVSATATCTYNFVIERLTVCMTSHTTLSQIVYLASNKVKGGSNSRQIYVQKILLFI